MYKAIRQCEEQMYLKAARTGMHMYTDMDCITTYAERNTLTINDVAAAVRAITEGTDIPVYAAVLVMLEDVASRAGLNAYVDATMDFE